MDMQSRIRQIRQRSEEAFHEHESKLPESEKKKLAIYLPSKLEQNPQVEDEQRALLELICPVCGCFQGPGRRCSCRLNSHMGFDVFR